MWVTTISFHQHQFPMTWTNPQMRVGKPLIYFSPCLLMVVGHHYSGYSAWGPRKVKTDRRERVYIQNCSGSRYLHSYCSSMKVWAGLRVLSRLLINRIKTLNSWLPLMEGLPYVESLQSIHPWFPSLAVFWSKIKRPICVCYSGQVPILESMRQHCYNLCRIITSVTSIHTLQRLKEEHQGDGWGHLGILLPWHVKSTQQTLVKVLKRVKSHQEKKILLGPSFRRVLQMFLALVWLPQNEWILTFK